MSRDFADTIVRYSRGLANEDEVGRAIKLLVQSVSRSYRGGVRETAPGKSMRTRAVAPEANQK